MSSWIRAHWLAVGLTIVMGAQSFGLAWRQQASWKTLGDLASPKGGQDASLIADVRAASDLLALLSIDQFDLAPELRKNRFFMQRMTDFNFPARLRADARAVLAPAAEPYVSHAGIICRSNYFVIYERAADER